MIRRVVADDPVALDLLDRAMVRAEGGDKRSRAYATTVDNVNSGQARPDGNSGSRALRKLRTDAADLHAEVLAGMFLISRAQEDSS